MYIPCIALHSRAYIYCRILDEKGIKVPDISFACGFAREDHIFKALAFGAPYSKLVCMGRLLKSLKAEIPIIGLILVDFLWNFRCKCILKIKGINHSF